MALLPAFNGDDPPVNPSDYGKWKGKPGPPPKPVAMGLEGSGTVVASGGGVMAGSMVGKRIGFTNPAKGQGSYSEYVTVSALQCFPMPDEVPLEDACSFFVNPFTAYAIVDTARSRGSPGLVLTAAASQLGQMLVKLCKEERYPIVCVVRREAQAETLRALGAEVGVQLLRLLEQVLLVLVRLEHHLVQLRVLALVQLRLRHRELPRRRELVDLLLLEVRLQVCGADGLDRGHIGLQQHCLRKQLLRVARPRRHLLDVVVLVEPRDALAALRVGARVVGDVAGVVLHRERLLLALRRLKVPVAESKQER